MTSDTTPHFYDTSALIDQTLSMFFDNGQDGLLGISTGFDALDSVTRGFIPGDVQVWIADTGVGKTTFTFELIYRVMTNNHKVMLLPLEMSPQSVMMKLAARHLQKPILSDPRNLGKVERSELHDALVWLSERLLIPKQFGKMSADKFEEYLEISRKRHDVQLVLLDHVTAAATGSDGLDWKSIDGFVSSSKDIMVRLGMTLLMVTHTTPTDKHDEGRRSVDLGDIRGSKSIAQYADIAFSIRRPEGLDSGLMEVRIIKKHRLIGASGKFMFRMLPSTVIEDVNNAERTTKQRENQRQDNQVRQQARGIGAQPQPEAEQTDRTSKLQDTAQVHTGLPSTRKESGESEPRTTRLPIKERLAARRRRSNRDEGLPERRGQDEDEVRSSITEGGGVETKNLTGSFGSAFAKRSRAFSY